MSDTKPMTAFFENRGIEPETHDYNLCMAAIESATTAQAEQIAALTVQNARLREALENNPITPDRLELLADWFDKRDRESGAIYDMRNLEVQRDLRVGAGIVRQVLAAPPADASGLLALVRAAGKIKHWHDTVDGMIVSKAAVFELWEAVEALDPAIKAAAERGGKG